MPGQLQTKDIGDVKCLLRTIVIPSHVLKKKQREKKNVDQLSSSSDSDEPELEFSGSSRAEL